MIAPTAIIYPNVHLGQNVRIEDYCVIGAPLRDGSQPPTVIGDGAWIRSHTVIYAGNRIGQRFQSGNKANLRELNDIGDDVSLGTLSVVEHHVQIGHRVRIHTGAFIPEYSVLKEGSWVGPHVVFTNAKVPLAIDAKNQLRGPTLEKGALIGANSTLSPGVVIGEGTLVGSGSNVTKSLPAHQIAVGNPAQILKERK